MLRATVSENQTCVIPGVRNWLFIFALTFVANAVLAYILMNFMDIYFPTTYNNMAKNILAGNGFMIEAGEDTFIAKPPIYAIFLAGVYYIFGFQHITLVLAQILINSCTSVLLYLLIKRIFSSNVGLIAAIVYAFYPFTAYYIVRATPVTFFTFSTIILIFAMYRLYNAPNRFNAFIAGCMIGVLTLIKFSFQGFIFFFILGALIIFLLDSKKEIEKHLYLSLIILAGFFIILSPWLVRNYVGLGVFPAIGSGGGYTFWLGNNVRFDGKDSTQLSSAEEVAEFQKEESEIKGNEYGGLGLRNEDKFYHAAFKSFIRFPKETAILMFKKIFRLWFWVYSIKMQRYQWLITSLQLSIILPALLGMFFSLKNRVKIWPIILILFYFQIIYTLFAPTIRYSLPLMPVVIGFAVYGVSEAYHKFKLVR